MEEEKVNQAIKKWLEDHNYHYKGALLNGDIPVAENRECMLDAHGTKFTINDNILSYIEDNGEFETREDINTDDLEFNQVWVECKGDVDLTTLFSGFTKALFAVYQTNGIGLLACPEESADKILNHKHFLSHLTQTINGQGKVGIASVKEGGEIDVEYL